jgi:hypothetical protein
MTSSDLRSVAARDLTPSRSLRGALVLFGILGLAAVLIAPPDRVRAARSHYRGTAVGDARAKVSFRVRTDEQGQPTRAGFRYENVQIYYEDGTTSRHSNPPVMFRFKNPRVFHNEYSNATGSLTSFYEVRGRLLPGGRAKGYLVHVVDFRNPPLPGFDAFPDWSTHGRVYWTAKLGR